MENLKTPTRPVWVLDDRWLKLLLPHCQQLARHAVLDHAALQMHLWR